VLSEPNVAGGIMALEDNQAPNRRSILKGLALIPTTATLAVGQRLPARAYDPGRQETGGRYRETDDVRAFYRTNGYETLKKR
jgi:hypothetical protein